MATRSRGGATRTIQPKEDKCGCKPSKGDGACCTTAACGCRKHKRGCGPKCGCYGSTRGRHPCKNPYTVGGQAQRSSASEGGARRRKRSVQDAFQGQGFSLGSYEDTADDTVGSVVPCPICSRMIPRSNVAMHAARCGVSEQAAATAVAEDERQFMRIQQESEYEVALRQDEEKIFAEQQRKLDEEKAEKARHRLAREHANKLEIVRRRLGPPPGDDCAESTTQIRIRLLDGSQIQRRFLASSALQLLFDFVDTSVVPMSNIAEADVTRAVPYVLRLQFPATEFVRPSSSVTPGPTLQELGLCPNALLLAEEQAMADARTTDQIRSPSDQDVQNDRDTLNLSQHNNLVVADHGGQRSNRPATTGRAAPAAGDERKRPRGVTADTYGPHQRPTPKRAAVVELLSSDEEGGASSEGSGSVLGGCWTCRVCTYAGNSVALQRCQICDRDRG